MSETNATGRSHLPGGLAISAVLAGVVVSLLYPLSVAGIVPGTTRMSPGIPQFTNPFLVVFSVQAGSILMTWGTFAYVGDDYAPLTPRRAAAAFLPALVSVALAVSWFVYMWTVTPPVDLEGQPADFTFVQLLRQGLVGIDFLALTGVASFFVGTVAATRDRWTALSTVVLPVGIIAIGFLWGFGELTLLGGLLTILFTGLPFPIGYATARTEIQSRTR